MTETADQAFFETVEHDSPVALGEQSHEIQLMSALLDRFFSIRIKHMVTLYNAEVANHQASNRSVRNRLTIFCNQ